MRQSGEAERGIQTQLPGLLFPVLLHLHPRPITPSSWCLISWPQLNCSWRSQCPQENIRGWGSGLLLPPATWAVSQGFVSLSTSFFLWDSIFSLYNGKTITWLSVGQRRPLPGKAGNLCHLRCQCCCWSWRERYEDSAGPDPPAGARVIWAALSCAGWEEPGRRQASWIGSCKPAGRWSPKWATPGSALWICTLTLPSPEALRLWFLMTLTWPTDVAESLTELWTRPSPTSYHSPSDLTTPQETNHPSYVSGTPQYAKPDSGAYSTQDWARLMTKQPFNIITYIHTNFCKYWHTKKRKDHCTE